MGTSEFTLDAPVTAPASRKPLAARALVAAVSLLVLAIAGVGVLLSVNVVSNGAPPAPDARRPAGPFGLVQAIPISYGALRVTGAQQLAGPTARKLAGVTHGVQSLVPPNKVQVQPRIVLTNLLKTPAAYSPASFELLAAKRVVARGRGPAAPPAGARAYRPSGATISAGTLQPGGSIEAQLTFVAPRNGSHLWLRFREPGRPRPVVVDLGRTGRTPPGAFAGYHQHGGSR
jgi:hypothetical protein